MKEKRMYSLNLAAYVMMDTNIVPKVGTEVNDIGTLCYLVFPENEAVFAAIDNYRKDTELHSFLNSYGLLRQMLNEARGDKLCMEMQKTE